MFSFYFMTKGGKLAIYLNPLAFYFSGDLLIRLLCLLCQVKLFPNVEFMYI